MASRLHREIMRVRFPSTPPIFCSLLVQRQDPRSIGALSWFESTVENQFSIAEWTSQAYVASLINWRVQTHHRFESDLGNHFNPRREGKHEKQNKKFGVLCFTRVRYRTFGVLCFTRVRYRT